MTAAPCISKTTTPPPLALPCPPTSANGHPTTTTQVKRKKTKINAISYFLCYRSVDVIVPDKRGEHSRDVIPYVAMGDKDGMFPKVVPLALSSPTSDNEGDDKENFRPTDQQPKKVKCGFSQVLNAVGLKTALAKKIQKKKPSKSLGSATNESSFSSSYNRNWSQEDVAAVEEKEGVVFPKVSLTASGLLGHEKEEEEEEVEDDRYWRNKGRRKLSRIFKTVLFETYLAKKIRKSTKGKTFGRNESLLSEEDDPRMASSDSTASSVTNISAFTTSSLNSSSSSMSHTSTSTTRSLSKRFKSFRSSSTRSFKSNLRYISDKFLSNSNRSSRPNSRSSSGKNKLFGQNNPANGLKEDQHGQDQLGVMSINEKKDNSGYYRSIVSLCFLFMGLLGLIFYGKICGILCTSMWLFSAPLWTNVGDRGSASKKKMIMGGLLARDNRTN